MGLKRIRPEMVDRPVSGRPRHPEQRGESPRGGLGIVCNEHRNLPRPDVRPAQRSKVPYMVARAIACVNSWKSIMAGAVVSDTSSFSTSTACTTKK